jgi:hypothetical protein
MAAEVYPTGVIDDAGPILNQPQGFHHGWLGQLLPYLEERTTYSHVDRDVSVYHKNNKPVRDINLPVFTCPSAPGGWMIAAGSGYAGVHHDVEAPIDDDNHGVFFLNSRLRYEDITDGITQTLFVGEKFMDQSTDLGWLSGTRGTLRNTGTPIGQESARSVRPVARADGAR